MRRFDIGAPALHDLVMMTPDTIPRRARDLAALDCRDSKAAPPGTDELRIKAVKASQTARPTRWRLHKWPFARSNGTFAVDEKLALFACHGP